jgi:deoxycytidylate deaminase
MYKSLKRFLDIETDSDDYEDGKFHSPNVGQCIADAEIHIANIKGIDKSAKIFYTMAEQWMKYAALILHPGLITPSSEERCMIVAYTAKYNSGCLSRQVGACITNQYHTIRTIGWNDVPYGQIPCSLREISDIYSEDKKSFYNYMYSDFEKPQKGNELKLYDNECYSFKEKVQNDYKQIEEHKDQLKGLPLSYCFKSLHNKYEGEKNQVYTRSLHAEENAMMQMVKYGGEALINGIIYVTASPCELCSKKLYQIGVRKIVYIDPYPGISKRHIIACGFKRPELKLFQGAYGSTYFKLYQPFMSYKDELGIRVGNTQYETKNYLLKRILKGLNKEFKATYTHEEISEILNKLDLDNKN